jgi:hypothetical protein
MYDSDVLFCFWKLKQMSILKEVRVSMLDEFDLLYMCLSFV